MKKLHKTRDFLAGMLAMALIVTMVAPAGAALVSKTIQVFTGLEIYVDGVKMEPTDANGKPVETFAYNGTTYVPLRAVSQSLGKNVKYDSATKRVYIGKMPGEIQYLLDVCPPYQTDGYRAQPTVTMMGQKYANGFSLYTINGYALFNLNGQYDTLEFDVGHIDGTKMNEDTTLCIYLDGELAFTLDMTGEMVVEHHVVPLNGALQMKVEMVDGYLNHYFALAHVTVE